jgi:hypothetical protein
MKINIYGVRNCVLGDKMGLNLFDRPYLMGCQVKTHVEHLLPY